MIIRLCSSSAEPPCLASLSPFPVFGLVEYTGSWSEKMSDWSIVRPDLSQDGRLQVVGQAGRS